MLDSIETQSEDDIDALLKEIKKEIPKEKISDEELAEELLELDEERPGLKSSKLEEDSDGT